MSNSNPIVILMISTVIIAGISILISYLILKKDKIKRWRTIAFGITLVTIALCCSYSALFVQINSTADLFHFISPGIMFILIFFIAILFSYWVLMLFFGIFNKERIAEFSAKIFGIEINYKYADELVTASEGYNLLYTKIGILNALNTEVIEFLGTDFESVILEYDLSERPKIIRSMISGVFNGIYTGYNTQINVSIVSLEDIDSLGEHAASIIYRYLPSVESNFITTTLNDKVGIGIHLSEDDNLSTVIFFDASQTEYQISLAELCLAGNLFMSLSTIIDWAERD